MRRTLLKRPAFIMEMPLTSITYRSSSETSFRSRNAPILSPHTHDTSIPSSQRFSSQDARTTVDIPSPPHETTICRSQHGGHRGHLRRLRAGRRGAIRRARSSDRSPCGLRTTERAVVRFTLTIGRVTEAVAGLPDDERRPLPRVTSKDSQLNALRDDCSLCTDGDRGTAVLSCENPADKCGRCRPGAMS